MLLNPNILDSGLTSPTGAPGRSATELPGCFEMLAGQLAGHGATEVPSEV